MRPSPTQIHSRPHSIQTSKKIYICLCTSSKIRIAHLNCYSELSLGAFHHICRSIQYATYQSKYRHRERQLYIYIYIDIFPLGALCLPNNLGICALLTRVCVRGQDAAPRSGADHEITNNKTQIGYNDSTIVATIHNIQHPIYIHIILYGNGMQIERRRDFISTPSPAQYVREPHDAHLGELAFKPARTNAGAHY